LIAIQTQKPLYGIVDCTQRVMLLSFAREMANSEARPKEQTAYNIYFDHRAKCRTDLLALQSSLVTIKWTSVHDRVEAHKYWQEVEAVINEKIEALNK